MTETLLQTQLLKAPVSEGEEKKPRSHKRLKVPPSIGLKRAKEEAAAGLALSRASGAFICCHGARLIWAWLTTSRRSCREVTEEGGAGCPGGDSSVRLASREQQSRERVLLAQAFTLEAGEGRESDARPTQSSDGSPRPLFPSKPHGSPAGEDTTLPYRGKTSAAQGLLSFCRGPKRSPADILRKHERETRAAGGFAASGQGACAGIRVWLGADQCSQASLRAADPYLHHVKQHRAGMMGDKRRRFASEAPGLGLGSRLSQGMPELQRLRATHLSNSTLIRRAAQQDVLS